MGSSWMEGDANLAHQVARGRHEERVARSLEAYAARGFTNGRAGWAVRFAWWHRIVSPVRIAGQLR